MESVQGRRGEPLRSFRTVECGGGRQDASNHAAVLVVPVLEQKRCSAQVRRAPRLADRRHAPHSLSTLEVPAPVCISVDRHLLPRALILLGDRMYRRGLFAGKLRRPGASNHAADADDVSLAAVEPVRIRLQAVNRMARNSAKSVPPSCAVREHAGILMCRFVMRRSF